MKPEERIKRRVGVLLDCANLSEVSRRTGYNVATISCWRKKPLSIPAVCLETLEQILGTGRNKYIYDGPDYATPEQPKRRKNSA